MPDEQSNTTLGLERLLDNVEDYSLQVHNYPIIQKALESAENISVQVVKKILLICVCDLKEDIKCSINDLTILSTLLKKIKETPCSPLPDLVPSAVVVLRILKTTALFNKVETLKILCFEIMGLYPDETLISLVVDQSNELMELFNLYCHQRIPMEVRVQPICLITKFLKILPPDKKTTFVKEGLNIWFSKIIPTVINCSTNHQSLEALELLTDELINIEYADNQHWKNVLACIYTPQKYPAIMKTLLEQGSDTWHRLWIVFIKLLKTQITKNTNTVGSPINSMLPVVEMAFKMDIPNRCRAFQCWNILIDNFATETNEVYVNKRLKLLIIPLSSNNAKVEETALAKLDTWWHLISCFYVKMDNFSQTMLITFLHFCFGKPASDKPIIIPGMISNKTKTECVKVFINLLGHADCNGCVEYPKLKDKLVNTKLLVSHWVDWIHSLSSALKICTENDFTDEQIECAWKTFVMTVGELPENNVRRDLFNEVLAILEKLPKDVINRHVEVIINILIPTLFENNEKIRPLLKTNTEVNSPIIKILTVLLRLPLSDIESRVNVNKLRKMTDYLVEDAFKTSSHTIEWLFKDLSSNNLLLWIALSESICEQMYSSCPRMLCKMLLWPFKYIDLFIKKSQGKTSWLKMYKILQSMQHMTTLKNDILTALLALNGSKSSNVFIFEILLEILHTTIDCEPLKKTEGMQVGELEKVVQLLYKSTSNLDKLDLDTILPTLSDIIILVCNSLTTIDENTAKNVVLSVANILKRSHSTLEKSDIDKDNILNYLIKILESLEIVFKKDAYAELKLLLIDDLKILAPFTTDEERFNRIKSVIYKSINTNDKFTELIKTFENSSNTDNEAKKQSSKDKFSTPTTKVAKKNQKKEASIVDTVVENGEEYVVVKSNWKFNPRKLTDNQKEKLQRKNEDIPALYQDLSQSQDDYKLATWKSDSMDTSTTSKSASVQGNEDASTILKNLPKTEFVPKMLENMISKEKATEQKLEGESDPEKPKSDVKISKVINKDTKSPRMALKDRVFRNVRNLIEKSSVSENVNTPNSNENVPKTPTTTRPNPMVSQINSAPSNINADRPSRVKRKPKKFDNLQLFGPKKRRCSAGNSDSPSDSELIESPVDSINTLIEPDITDKIVEDKNDLKDNINKTNEEVLTDPQSCKESETPELESDDMFDKIRTVANEEKKIEVAETSKIITEEKQTGEVLNNEILEETMTKTLDTKLDSTPTVSDKNKKVPKTSYKKISKKSRIEKELAIDMVEGHPFLKGHSEKRSTRKAFSNSPSTSPYTRNNISLKTNRSKSEPKTSPKGVKKNKDLNVSIKKNLNDVITETQDVIESSQESTVTTISVKSTKSIGNKSPLVILEKTTCTKTDTQKLLDDTKNDSHTDTKEDIEFPCNKTAKDVLIDLTENMDTEPMDKCSDVIIINDEEELPVEESYKNETIILETQNTAEADTQSMDPNMFVDTDKNPPLKADEVSSEIKENDSNIDVDINMTNSSLVATPDDVTKTMTESVLADVHNDEACSSFKDDEQRKKDFLNNTLEISPIKIVSPVRDKQSLSPETSSDYVVVKLSSPVQMNGEPFHKCVSPEIFTEDKVSLEIRDVSPPREEISVSNSSPRSSMSLKKSKPQVRSGGRAAQMLGLCVPDRLQTINTSEKTSDIEDNKKSPSVNTSARRNLRILYNSTNGENNDTSEAEKDIEGSATFLKFERSLPSVDCSPSVPILKRKLAEITDEATASPASKRKRVSFHDPPVSTTICVKKYIEPCGIRSPQNSATKRQERLLRPLPVKSPKRLDNVFKLDSVLTKTVESFTDNSDPMPLEQTEDTEMNLNSLDQTPTVEIIKTSDLNDKDPICLELVSCEDPISNIATELSSPTMKVLLVKEFEEKVSTIGDLAKMTELEINRLCIKAPKVQVAKKVLNDYVKNKKDDIISTTDSINESIVPELFNSSTEVQTDLSVDNIEIPDKLEVTFNSTQTDSVLTSDCSVQTNEIGNKTTAEIITSCLEDRKDFIDNLCDKMDETSIQKIADNLSFNALNELIMEKITSSNYNDFLNRVIEHQRTLSSDNDDNSDTRLSIVQDYLCNTFTSKDLILFCSNLLRKVHEKSS